MRQTRRVFVIFAAFIIITLLTVLIWKQEETDVYAGTPGAWDSSTDSADVAGWGFSVFGDSLGWAELAAAVQESIQARTDSSDIAVWNYRAGWSGQAEWAESATEDTIVITGITSSCAVVITPHDGLSQDVYVQIKTDTVFVYRNIGGEVQDDHYSYVINIP